jgi:hypothetical protein
MKYKYRNGERVSGRIDIMKAYEVWKWERKLKRWNKNGIFYGEMPLIKRLFVDISTLYDGIKRQRTLMAKIKYLQLIHKWHVYGRMNEDDRIKYSKKILKDIHERIVKEDEETKYFLYCWNKDKGTTN